VRFLASFRLYRLDGVGKISGAEWIEADADQSAIVEARERITDGSFELWDGQRLVARERAGQA
jgi:hypothetical protein